jgi:hypothetical protein
LSSIRAGFDILPNVFSSVDAMFLVVQLALLMIQQLNNVLNLLIAQTEGHMSFQEIDVSTKEFMNVQRVIRRVAILVSLLQFVLIMQHLMPLF